MKKFVLMFFDYINPIKYLVAFTNVLRNELFTYVNVLKFDTMF